MATDVEKLAKLRIVVARFGEMDRNKWWNTKGLLSNLGELAISRGFPKTHVFARSRAAFAVAAARSDEVFNPPDSYTLWRLPVEIEDQLETAWASWLEKPDPWKDFLAQIEKESSTGLVSLLEGLDLVSQKVVDRVTRLRRGDDLRSVSVKAGRESPEDLIATLAGAHSCSEPGKLAVPYVRQEEFPE